MYTSTTLGTTRARSSNNATATIGAVSARKMCGPDPDHGKCSMASSAGSKPPSGPTTAVTPSGQNLCRYGDFSRPARGSTAIGQRRLPTARERRRRRARKPRPISGMRSRLAAASRAVVHRPFDRALGLLGVPTNDAAPCSDRRDPRDADLRAARDHGVERARLRERDRERHPRDDLRLCTKCSLRAPRRRRPDHRFDLVAPPRPGAIGDRDVLADPQAANALQVVPVGSGDLDGVVEVGDERVRRGVFGRRPREGHSRNGARIPPEKKPRRWGGVSLFALAREFGEPAPRAARPCSGVEVRRDLDVTSKTRSPRPTVAQRRTPRP